MPLSAFAPLPSFLGYSGLSSTHPASTTSLGFPPLQDGLQEKNPVRNFLDDPRRSGSFAESDRWEGSRRHIRNWGGPDFDKVKTGKDRGKEWPTSVRGTARPLPR